MQRWVSQIQLQHLGEGLPKWLNGKEVACQAGDNSSIPESGRSPREGNGNPLQYSCLENPMDRGAWWATVHGITTVGHNLATKLYWTIAHQAPLSMGFSRQEYCSGLPFPSPGDLPNPRIKPRSPALQADALTSEPPGKPKKMLNMKLPFLSQIIFSLFFSLQLIS